MTEIEKKISVTFQQITEQDDGKCSRPFFHFVFCIKLSIHAAASDCIMTDIIRIDSRCNAGTKRWAALMLVRAALSVWR